MISFFSKKTEKCMMIHELKTGAGVRTECERDRGYCPERSGYICIFRGFTGYFSFSFLMRFRADPARNQPIWVSL